MPPIAVRSWMCLLRVAILSEMCRRPSHGACLMVQENAAAFLIELTKEDKQYLEDVFHKDKVSTVPCTVAFRYLTLYTVSI